ncbi:hypothetical protein IAT38_000277 [Cryptococcus sp. DSM 104549]
MAANTQQRDTPRDLTLAEMWAGYDWMPEELRRAYRSPNNTVPARYPRVRTTYQNLSPSDAAEEHIIRKLKYNICDHFMRFGDRNDFGLYAPGRSHILHRHTMQQKKTTPPSELPDLRVRLQRAEIEKQKANASYRNGKFMDATAQYLEAWAYLLLPYCTKVLSPSDPNRAWLGRVEGSIWSNLSASFLAVGQIVGDHVD